MAKIKFAVVDNSKLFHQLMKQNINSGSYGEYFFNHLEFGMASIKKFDIIFLGQVGGLGKEWMAKSISKKTKAIIILISENDEVITDEIATNSEFRIERRDTFFEYNDAQKFLKPFYSRINQMKTFRIAKKEMSVAGEELVSFLKVGNGY